MLLEVCADSLRSAIAAENGGAMRLELCQDLSVGGTTPAEDLFLMVKERVSIPVRVLLRPHAWDFCYDKDETDLLCRCIRRFRKAGADGIVIGALTPQGDVDKEAMRRFLQEAEGLPVTFHRAFDQCRDAIAALDDIMELGGIDTLLTSGQAVSAEEGWRLLAELVRHSDGRVNILAGGGVKPESIPFLHRAAGVTAFHLSGKKTVKSPAEFARSGVSLGSAVSGIAQRVYTDESIIRAARKEFDKIKHLHFC